MGVNQDQIDILSTTQCRQIHPANSNSLARLVMVNTGSRRTSRKMKVLVIMGVAVMTSAAPLIAKLLQDALPGRLKRVPIHSLFDSFHPTCGPTVATASEPMVAVFLPTAHHR
jgi:hypothetical protein